MVGHRWIAQFHCDSSEVGWRVRSLGKQYPKGLPRDVAGRARGGDGLAKAELAQVRVARVKRYNVRIGRIVDGQCGRCAIFWQARTAIEPEGALL